MNHLTSINLVYSDYNKTVLILWMILCQCFDCYCFVLLWWITAGKWIHWKAETVSWRNWYVGVCVGESACIWVCVGECCVCVCTWWVSVCVEWGQCRCVGECGLSRWYFLKVMQMLMLMKFRSGTQYTEHCKSQMSLYWSSLVCSWSGYDAMWRVYQLDLHMMYMYVNCLS